MSPVAHVGDAAIAEREDAALPVRRDFEIVDLVAFLAHRHQVLVARLDPAHRAAKLAREVTDHDVLAVERRLDAEAAALIAGGDDPNVGGRKLQEVGERKTLDVGALRRQVEGEPVGIAPDRERALVSMGQMPQRWVRKRCLSTTSAVENSASTCASFSAMASASNPPV